MSVCRASAPCHQPMRAPATIHSFWKSQCLTFAFDFFGCAASHVPSAAARSGSGISSSGSFLAPGTTNAGGRLAGAAGCLGAGFAAAGAVVVAAAGAVVVVAALVV